jgi:hypothetical protein
MKEKMILSFVSCADGRPFEMAYKVDKWLADRPHVGKIVGVGPHGLTVEIEIKFHAAWFNEPSTNHFLYNMAWQNFDMRD